jgi:hypothetical protein
VDPEKSDRTDKAERERKRKEVEETPKQRYRTPKLTKFGPTEELTGVAPS